VTLVQSVLADFFAYTARYWTILLVLVALHLFLQASGNKRGAPPDTNPGVLESFFRKGFALEDDIFQGRSRAEFVLSKTGEAICVHVHWRNKPLGAAQVEEIALARRKLYCRYAIIISRGGFTLGARRQAAALEVALWDMHLLERHLHRFSASLAEAAAARYGY